MCASFLHRHELLSNSVVPSLSQGHIHMQAHTGKGTFVHKHSHICKNWQIVEKLDFSEQKEKKNVWRKKEKCKNKKIKFKGKRTFQKHFMMMKTDALIKIFKLKCFLFGRPGVQKCVSLLHFFLHCWWLNSVFGGEYYRTTEEDVKTITPPFLGHCSSVIAPTLHCIELININVLLLYIPLVLFYFHKFMLKSTIHLWQM